MENRWTKKDHERPENKSASLSVMSTIELLRSASEALFTQVKLHQELVSIEWAQEKKRLSLMLAASLFGFACLICLLFFIGILALALSWNTDFRIHSIIILCATYGFCAYFAWNRLRVLAKCPDRFFSSTREELAADIALIKSKLS